MEVSPAIEAWVATALLHRERPDEEAFRLQEIVDKAYSLGFAARPRAGTVLHVTQHCVANKAPSPLKLRMLYATKDNRRRLFRDGDDFHPGRAEGPIRPEREDVPSEYRELVDWYDDAYTVTRAA